MCIHLFDWLVRFEKKLNSRAGFFSWIGVRTGVNLSWICMRQCAEACLLSSL
jgi:hypothetical protein